MKLHFNPLFLLGIASFNCEPLLFSDCQELHDLPQEAYEYHVLNAMDKAAEDIPFVESDDPDLEKMIQPFVLETKKIEITCCPGAFNPTITRWNGGILLGFRIRNLKTGATNQIGLNWMDENFNLLGPAQLLNMPVGHLCEVSKLQDPRLISIDDRLYVSFSEMMEGVFDRDIRRMYVAEVIHDGKYFHTNNPSCFTSYEGENPQRWEKNWITFDYNGNLMMIYSPIPHRIFRPLLGKGKCETIASSWASVQWPWGQLRGGTPALKIGNEYLSIFHSSKYMKSKQSLGKNIAHYFMGAYTFSAEPPFEITRISKTPIVGKDFYNGPAYKTWKPLRVVFPCGLIADDNYLWIAYGKQDYEIWIAKIDKKALLESLVPVTSIIETKNENP
ncbi:MAG TPA: hypothetical protein VLG49_05020 [Rhabdochlamydiaceae bacterium]|nr:hypothetical protein [Rhabdochlamydiaceae bacterium]